MKRASRNWESIGSVQTIRLSAANLLPGRQDGHNPLLIVASRQQRPQVPRTLRRAEMPQRLRLDLPDALPREVELLADLFERVLALAADAEAQADHLLLPRSKPLDDVGHLVADVGAVHCVDGRAYLTIFDQVA